MPLWRYTSLIGFITPNIVWTVLLVAGFHPTRHYTIRCVVYSMPVLFFCYDTLCVSFSSHCAIRLPHYCLAPPPKGRHTPVTVVPHTFHIGFVPTHIVGPRLHTFTHGSMPHPTHVYTHTHLVGRIPHTHSLVAPPPTPSWFSHVPHTVLDPFQVLHHLSGRHDGLPYGVRYQPA